MSAVLSQVQQHTPNSPIPTNLPDTPGPFETPQWGHHPLALLVAPPNLHAYDARDLYKMLSYFFSYILVNLIILSWAPHPILCAQIQFPCIWSSTGDTEEFDTRSRVKMYQASNVYLICGFAAIGMSPLNQRYRHTSHSSFSFLATFGTTYLPSCTTSLKTNNV